MGVVSGRRKTPRRSMSLGGGFKAMRRDSGLLTLDQSDGWGSDGSSEDEVSLWAFF